jgi:energy-coupling factor transporter ATP-binding protein EcfA2
MALDRITLSRFRNHRDSLLTGTQQFNLLIGENGAGKTNVLEALSLLAPGRGLRRAALEDMAQTGDTGFTIGADLMPDEVRLGTYTEAERTGRRLVRVNGAAATALSLGEWLSIAWLTPAMDGLFTGTASERRQFMDRLAVALDPLHAAHASRYAAATRERTAFSQPTAGRSGVVRRGRAADGGTWRCLVARASRARDGTWRGTEPSSRRAFRPPCAGIQGQGVRPTRRVCTRRWCRAERKTAQPGAR